MIDLRGHILLPEYGIDDDDQVTVSPTEIANLISRIEAAADKRIAICVPKFHNLKHIVLFADFGNHGHHKLAALEEIERLVRPFEDRLRGQLKGHLFAYDDEKEIRFNIEFGDPYSPFE